MVKVYIDGQEGTTGLKILERFEGRNDIELLKIDEDKRKDNDERRKMINAADFVFLCLPDDAAREAVAMADDKVRIIDASTAHRTNADWAYGFPELGADFRSKIEKSSRTAVPGCYASGFISMVYPLIKLGIMPKDYPITCHAVSGYSGAGKKAIAVYEGENRPNDFDSPRQYALTQQHKHLPEMQKICGLDYAPAFNPLVCDYYSGMVVSLPIFTRLLTKKYSVNDIRKALSDFYEENGSYFVKVMAEGEPEDGFIGANNISGTNMMQIFVNGNDERLIICSRLDNLGKGASGAAVQCLNIMMGIDEKTGLI
ncbi:MAG: N-acetyl-gamma-glutamyl-phosphate reductase [Oscillospiraceae bacterium]|nr:N-acetyl-gamma-glutamyl-phosphate reductase [Oscillospiraceae bacterium]